MSDNAIESTLKESRVFEPPAPAEVGAPRWLVDSAGAYETMYRRSIDDPEGFWGEIARGFRWSTPFDAVLSGEMPDARWFEGGTLNACDNCVDRFVREGHGDDVAIIWEGEPVDGGSPEIRRLTYRELQEQTARLGNALKKLGGGKGEVVTIYMGMVPELAIAMLACARIGAPALRDLRRLFRSQAIADRVTDADSRIILTCDGAWRRGKVVPLKDNVDAAIEKMGAARPGRARWSCSDAARTRSPIHGGRDQDWRDLLESVDDGAPASPWTPRTCCSSCTPAAPRASPRASSTPPRATWSTPRIRPGRSSTSPPTPTRSTGAPPTAAGSPGTVHRVRHPAQPRAHAHVRGRAQRAARGPLLGHRRAPQGHALLHRAHGHPRVHEVGRRAPREARSWLVAGPGHRGRAHQPRGVDVVPREDRFGSVPDRRYLLADRDRRPRHHAPARGHPDAPGSCTRPFFGVDAAVVHPDGSEVAPSTAG